MLALLVDQRNRIVSKEELLDQIWPNRYICDTTLSACLKELRKVLGDSGSRQSIIKTIPRQGFQFIAELQEKTAARHSPETAEMKQSAVSENTTNNFKAEPLQQSLQAPESIVPAQGELVCSEHKNITVLRGGLVNADALVERLDPEALHYLLQDVFAVAQEVVVRFDGQITQWLSDGFAVLFGASIAHEDHARRALLAAYQLVDRSKNLPQAELSFGISSGEAIINSIPDHPKRCYTAYSQVLQAAQALQIQTDPGRIAVSLESYGILRADVRGRPLPGSEGRGVLVEEVIETRPGVPRRFRRPMAPLIGRTRELKTLQQHLRQAEGCAVAIIGASGTGKSRLLYEFCLGTSSQKARIIHVNGFPHRQSSPYHVLRELLRQCCGIMDGDSASCAEIKLRSCVQRNLSDTPLALALLLKLLDLNHDTATLESLSAQTQRDKTAVYLEDLLLQNSQFLIMAMEDLQYVDTSSQTWLTGFVRRLKHRPVLLIVTYRPGLQVDWLELPWVSRLVLGPLSPGNCRRLLAALPRSGAMRDRWEELVERCGGNPFFLEELTLSAARSNRDIPDTIKSVLAARIDQLGPADKKLLQTAAIIGQQGSLSLLADVSEMEPQMLRNVLQRLQDAELLYARSSLEEDLFFFRHALIQEVAYGQLLSVQRQALHQQIASTWRRKFPEQIAKKPEFLAHHYGQAGHYEEAVRGWQRAGRKAYERCAYSEAINYINQGLALLEGYKDSASRAVDELVLLRTLGPTLVAMQGYGPGSVEHIWIRAKELCEQVQDRSGLFRVLIGLGQYYLVTGQFDRAFACYRQMLRLAHKSYNKALLFRARAAMGELMMRCGRMRSAQRQYDQGLGLIVNDRQSRLASQTATVTALSQAAWVYWQLAEDHAALSYAEQALQRAKASRQPFTLVIALCYSAELQRFREQPQKALILAQEGAAIAQQQAFPYWQGWSQIIQGWAEVRTGVGGRGIDAIRQGMVLFQTTGAKIHHSAWLGALADAYRYLGQHPQALTAVDEALALIEVGGDRLCLPQLQRLRKIIMSQV